MTALAEALVAAQRAAVQALAKGYLGGNTSEDELLDKLTEIGCTDVTDAGYLLNTLRVLKLYGAVPTNGSTYQERRTNEPATQPQLDLIAKLVREGKHEPADTSGLTKAKASELIGELQTGRYDPAKWSVPF